ncbi:MAG: DUF3099 domain-containing protein [Streptosporangiales bacterium]|nr:DUF3099 domain-containing protein [Streptosporangiales bacterium]
MPRLRKRSEVVHTVTDAHRPMSEDIGYRERRYMITMAIRTACLILAFFVHGPWRFVALAGAIFLPYFAVIFANGGREPEPAVSLDSVDPDEGDGREFPGGRREIPS